MEHKFEKTFYEYLMTERGNQTDLKLSDFSEAVFHDTNFPKQAKSYQELSDYLELSTNYLDSMTIFDEAWQIYVNQHDIYK